ncbi:MAG TPA: hypothetical protein VFV01_47985 [Spirillospora sp.]|nr:hypothetical protein [Spirillospora sp.]
MKAKVKTRWVEALRSDEYQQGKGWLHQIDQAGQERFCCLGVLCEIAAQDGVIEPGRESARAADGVVTYDYAGCSGLLPDEVAEWAEIGEDAEHGTDGDGDVTVRTGGLDGWPNVGWTGVAELNDAGVPFSKIADLIEESL